MVTASLFYTVLAYERFHKNALLLDSGGNLYREVSSKLLKNRDEFNCNLGHKL